MDITDNPRYRSIISWLPEGEDLLWHGKSDLKCYQQYMRSEYIKGLVVISIIILLAIVSCLIAYHGKFAKGVVPQLVVVELAWIALLGCFILSPSNQLKDHYAVTSQHIVTASWNQGRTVLYPVAWKHIKSIKVQSKSGDLMTIIIKPYFWSGHNIYDFRCIAEGNEVLALITAHRPDLYSDQWFS